MPKKGDAKPKADAVSWILRWQCLTFSFSSILSLQSAAKDAKKEEVKAPADKKDKKK